MDDQQTTNMNLFNHGLLKVFKEQWHPDIWLLAGDDDHKDPIPAHKVVLAARSGFLKEICNEDDLGYEQMITLYEMNHEELEVFIEFMYVGNSMSSEKLKKHARSLFGAANLYKIPLLRDMCRCTLLSSSNTRNVLDILELSKDDPHEKKLFDISRRYVICHMKVIVFTDEFESFVERNPKLAVEMFKSSL